jgi:hypothetical protein
MQLVLLRFLELLLFAESLKAPEKGPLEDAG